MGIRSKLAEIIDGSYIVVLEKVNNGLINLNEFDTGKIIHHQNQVEATIWFRHFGQYATDNISKALGTGTSYGKKGGLDGLAIKLKRESFAIKYNYRHEHNTVTVNEERAITIPFFEVDQKLRQSSNFSKRNKFGEFEPMHLYYLEDIVDCIESEFAGWVEENLKTREISDEEKENGDFPQEWDTCLTDESNELFAEKKSQLELAFAKATGVFYEFNGGLIIE
ncbi:hypothetical protein [Heyndrickxia camelliae]|uniref:Uncharacterized protein n=1 Tax=Heyndrickxia camelliae TaxID=1707093 RepID=A0A2N3LCY0_9BACI|nr:hypothetical protein [Heyndrickxia camelliae]PKR82423.1 hypothetical protein CWO92_24575 [Heyndrickxia camelliae]